MEVYSWETYRWTVFHSYVSLLEGTHELRQLLTPIFQGDNTFSSLQGSTKCQLDLVDMVDILVS